MTSLHDVQVRLDAFVADHYHRAPHGGLVGKMPAEVWARARCRALEESTLTAAFLQHLRRRVRKDGTVDVAGRTWQLDQGFLAGRVISIERQSFYAVSRHVEERAEERIHPVFLLDEAHLLHQDTLEHLHIWLN